MSYFGFSSVLIICLVIVYELYVIRANVKIIINVEKLSLNRPVVLLLFIYSSYLFITLETRSIKLLIRYTKSVQKAIIIQLPQKVNIN